MSVDTTLNILASIRTTLANERTLLSYIRTAIMLAVSGVTLIKFFAEDMHFLIIGFILPPIALALVIFGVIRYRIMSKQIKN